MQQYFYVLAGIFGIALAQDLGASPPFSGAGVDTSAAAATLPIRHRHVDDGVIGAVIKIVLHADAPASDVNVVLDTGSSNLFLLESALVSSAASGSTLGARGLRGSALTSAEETELSRLVHSAHETHTCISFGSGSVCGRLAQADSVIVGAGSSAFTLHNVPLLIVPPHGLNLDLPAGVVGILGLGFDGLTAPAGLVTPLSLLPPGMSFALALGGDVRNARMLFLPQLQPSNDASDSLHHHDAAHHHHDDTASSLLERVAPPSQAAGAAAVAATSSTRDYWSVPIASASFSLGPLQAAVCGCSSESADECSGSGPQPGNHRDGDATRAQHAAANETMHSPRTVDPVSSRQGPGPRQPETHRDASPSCAAIIDSGTSFIGLPSRAFRAFLDLVTTQYNCRPLDPPPPSTGSKTTDTTGRSTAAARGERTFPLSRRQAGGATSHYGSSSDSGMHMQRGNYRFESQQLEPAELQHGPESEAPASRAELQVGADSSDSEPEASSSYLTCDCSDGDISAFPTLRLRISNRARRLFRSTPSRTGGTVSSLRNHRHGGSGSGSVNDAAESLNLRRRLENEDRYHDQEDYDHHDIDDGHDANGSDDVIIIPPSDYVRILPSWTSTQCIPLILDNNAQRLGVAGDVLVLGWPLFSGHTVLFEPPVPVPDSTSAGHWQPESGSTMATGSESGALRRAPSTTSNIRPGPGAFASLGSTGDSDSESKAARGAAVSEVNTRRRRVTTEGAKASDESVLSVTGPDAAGIAAAAAEPASARSERRAPLSAASANTSGLVRRRTETTTSEFTGAGAGSEASEASGFAKIYFMRSQSPPQPLVLPLALRIAAISALWLLEAVSLYIVVGTLCDAFSSCRFRSRIIRHCGACCRCFCGRQGGGDATVGTGSTAKAEPTGERQDCRESLDVAAGDTASVTSSLPLPRDASSGSARGQLTSASSPVECPRSSSNPAGPRSLRLLPSEALVLAATPSAASINSTSRLWPSTPICNGCKGKSSPHPCKRFSNHHHNAASDSASVSSPDYLVSLSAPRLSETCSPSARFGGQDRVALAATPRTSALAAAAAVLRSTAAIA